MVREMKGKKRKEAVLSSLMSFSSMKAGQQAGNSFEHVVPYPK